MMALWMVSLSLAFKQAWRDARAGDLRLLVLAVMVAVAAVTSVAFLSDRVGRALERDALQMLGADLVVEADAAIPDAMLGEARSNSLKVVKTYQFPSMVGAAQKVQLASIKAVEQGYPLRGALLTTAQVGADSQSTNEAPEIGQIWVDPQILAQTGLRIGDQLKVGDLQLKIARVITYEPDRGPQFVNLAPRVMMRAEDLARSGLLGPGSRVGYALLVAGESAAVESYKTWLTAQLSAGQKIVSVESGRPEIRRSLDRAQQFLALVAMLAVLIAAVAVALAARRFSQRHRQSVAVMRCLGATRRSVTIILLGEFLIVGVLGSVLGILIGWGAQSLMIFGLGGLLGTDLPGSGWMPALQGLFAGVWLLFAFAWPPLQALRSQPPSEIFRTSHTAFPLQSWLGSSLGILGFAALMWWVAHDLKFGAGLAGGFLVATILFAGVTRLALFGLAAMRGRLQHYPVLRFALAGVVRRRAATIAQTSALAVGMMAILLLTIVRTDLIAGWQRTLPADAPNRFLINVQDDQKDDVQKLLTESGFSATTLSPMVRGRLIARNGQSLSASDYEDTRAQRLIDREFNLSYAQALPDPNQIVSGRALDPNLAEVSLEKGLAKTLGLSLGDTLEFDVAGQPVNVKVTSIRSVDWDSMRANFFAIMTPRALSDAPQTWMTAFHVAPHQTGVVQSLVARFPNLTVFDVGAILAQLQSILDKVSVAVQGLFVFSVLAGAIVLAAALSATRDERVHESALLRAFGATRQQLARAQRIELLAVGAMAGLLAAGAASLCAWGLSVWVFEFDMKFALWPWLLGVSVCMLGAWLTGALTLRGVLNTPPLAILRHV
jgi:putative ABC transport system permease protein